MNAEDIRTVLVVGAGTMGGQIALQCAIHGLDVHLYDVSAAALESGMARVGGYARHLIAEGRADAAVLQRLTPTTDLAAAAAAADLVSESVPEDPALKGQVFAALHTLCPVSYTHLVYLAAYEAPVSMVYCPRSLLTIDSPFTTI